MTEPFAGTNQGENIWSVTKRHARKLFGGRILARQLDSLYLEWMVRANQPELFASPIAFLRFTRALRVGWVNRSKEAFFCLRNNKIVANTNI
ncbi:MAG: hypothetical protein D8G53_11860 [Candidatus Saccharimonas sp.]|nr:MAG: hypothetical protein D8G53_11860 [Candidatus Saccharimonas sp.]